ncbi:hypothetical protein XHC_4027 [Xanthomonas hortorum pv. carotae str. M081]|nr:hypothetical protein XHC_4027 [Xanthomonas hortorum pv. carotae str. M081]
MNLLTSPLPTLRCMRIGRKSHPLRSEDARNARACRTFATCSLISPCLLSSPCAHRASVRAATSLCRLLGNAHLPRTVQGALRELAAMQMRGMR